MPKIKEFEGLSEEELFEVFESIFFDELESWFSADIFCCDYCYQHVEKDWPGIANDENFQRQSIDMRCFYSGSRVREFFTELEFDELSKKISCPKCNSSSFCNMWPYNFEMADKFKDTLCELNELSKKTPFLLLTHPFAQETLKLLEKLCAQVGLTDVQTAYYRGRSLDKGKKYIKKDFMSPPPNVTREGRYNHAGTSVLYLGDSPQTCFSELGKPECGIAIAKIKIEQKLKLLDWVDIDEDDNILYTAAKSSLMSSPGENEGWFKPEYIFTRFIADCAIHAGFDGIKYPSIRRVQGHNMVLLNPSKQWKNIGLSAIEQMDEPKSYYTK